jgi:hypothetical protein
MGAAFFWSVTTTVLIGIAASIGLAFRSNDSDTATELSRLSGEVGSSSTRLEAALKEIQKLDALRSPSAASNGVSVLASTQFLEADSRKHNRSLVEFIDKFC